MAGASAGAGRAGPGHEKKDISLRGAALLAASILAVVPLVLVAMNWTFEYFAARETRSQPPPVSLIRNEGRPLPPEPRLQTTPTEDLRRVRAEEEAVLGSYAWVDRSAGKVRIPIGRAIDLLAESEAGR